MAGLDDGKNLRVCILCIIKMKWFFYAFVLGVLTLMSENGCFR